MKRNQRSKQQLIIDKYIDGAHKACILCTLAVLIDQFDFTEDECKYFLDDFNTLLKSYNSGNEDIYLIAENIKEYCGLKIL